MMAGKAQREVVLQLFGVIEIGAENIVPASEDAEESIGRSAHFDQSARLRHETSLEKWRGVVDLEQ